MFVDSRVLIHDTIARLEALADILSVEGDGQAIETAAMSPDERTRKEIGLSIRVLLPKLRSFRVADDVHEPPRRRVCQNCED